MPSRLVRATILTSEPVNQLDAPSEVFYRRLMSVVDDFGRYDARPSILRAACYPLRIDRTREADISRWLASCQTAGLIVLYTVQGKPYLELLKLGKPRAETSKFPSPKEHDDSAIGENEQVNTDENGCIQKRPYSYSYSGSDSIPPGENSEVPHHAAKRLAVAAFERWSQCAPPLGRQRELNASANEVKEVWNLVESEAQGVPIIRNGEQIGRHLLIPEAVDQLIGKPKEFRDMRWAMGCVKSRLNEMSLGIPASPSAGRKESIDERVARLARETK